MDEITYRDATGDPQAEARAAETLLNEVNPIERAAGH